MTSINFNHDYGLIIGSWIITSSQFVAIIGTWDTGQLRIYSATLY